MSESKSQRKKREAAEYNAAYEAKQLYISQYRTALEMSEGLPKPHLPQSGQTESRRALMAAALITGSIPYFNNHS